MRTYVGRAAGSATLNASNAASLAGGALLELGVGEGVAGKEGDGESEDAGELHFAGGYRKLRICCLGLWCCLGGLELRRMVVKEARLRWGYLYSILDVPCPPYPVKDVGYKAQP